ncbi:tumor necrosis factor ligand superfamily member 9, partial [Macrotis lagotis]|uniref:tumor necrosis factor ligand superfamily member 9 n=1 Tax=Macrotis lagotis TaxID=92651 RepID=UPI003D696487
LRGNGDPQSATQPEDFPFLRPELEQNFPGTHPLSAGAEWGCGVGSPPRKGTLPGPEDKAGPPGPAGTRPVLAMGSDPENPAGFPQTPSRTCRALDWVLGTALLLLAGVLAASTALRANPGPSPTSTERSAAPFPTKGPYAQLVMKDVLVKNQTLNWYSNPNLSGILLDPQMNYDDDKGELEVRVAGLYFIYTHLKLQQVVVPAYSQGIIEVSGLVVRPSGSRTFLNLSLDVGPSSTSIVTISEFSLIYLDHGDRLKFRMNTPAGDFLDWQLLSETSTFGLFWVAGKRPLTESGTFTATN